MTNETMKYKYNNKSKKLPTGGKVVAMVDHKGSIYVATEHHVYRTKPDSDEFYQCTFKQLEEPREKAEQAEQIAQNRKVHTMLKELADFEPDFENTAQCRWFIQWCVQSEKARVAHSYNPIASTIFFKTEEELHEAVKAVKDKFGDDAIELYCKHGVI